MNKYVLYLGGFFLSFALVFGAVYGWVVLLHAPMALPWEKGAEDRPQSVTEIGVDSLAADSLAQDSTGQVHHKTDDEVIGYFSLGQLDSLLFVLQHPGIRTKKKEPSPPRGIDSAAVQQMIDTEVTKREMIIDSLRAAMDSLKNSFAKPPPLPAPPVDYKKLAKIYEAMDPASAANALNAMNEQNVAAILERMKQRQAAEILASLSPERAAKLSSLILQKE